MQACVWFLSYLWTLEILAVFQGFCLGGSLPSGCLTNNIRTVHTPPPHSLEHFLGKHIPKTLRSATAVHVGTAPRLYVKAQRHSCM